MRDVAEQVGVSIKSVSRVLNGEDGVSPSTADRIRAVAQELGFRRNDLARGLRRQDRTETIGVVAQHSANRFFDGISLGIERVAAQHDALVLSTATRTGDREQATLLSLSSRRVDGLVILPAGPDQSFLRADQAAGIPLVFVDRPPSGIEADVVLTDNRGGAHGSTTHLIHHRHRGIGVVGPGPSYTVSERVAGHRQALADAALPVDGPVALGCGGAAEAQAAAAEMLELRTPPTAIFALNNVCAIGAARALRAAGKQHTVALVGFDDFEPADLLDPPLTVVAQDPEAMGAAAAAILFARLQGDQGPATTTMLPTRLIVRGSGEVAPLNA